MTAIPTPIDEYLQTDFIAFDGERECSIRIGEQSAEFDALLLRYEVTGGVFITGWNPFSQLLHAWVNQHANARMAAHFVERGVPALPHVGRSTDGIWFEEGFFALGLTEKDGLAIATSFDQHAIVVVTFGGMAELQLT